MQQNYFKCVSIVLLLVMFLFPCNLSAQTERQGSNGNSESALIEESTTKTPQTNIPILTAEQISKIRIPNIQLTSNSGDGVSAVYLNQDFENAFTGDPAAPPGWTQSRVVLLGDGIPEPNGTNGEKDWQQNVWTGSAWSLPGYTSGIKPTGAVSGTGVLFIEDGYFGSTTSAGYGSRRLESPSVNLTTSTSPYVRFYYFYNSSSSNLHVRVMASSNGGTTWNPIMLVPPNANVTTSMTTATPWQRINVLIPAAYRSANAKFGIEMTNVWGTNDIYIDDFVIEDFTPTTITSAASGTWSNTATWVGGIIPTADNHVVIATGHAVTLDVNIARCQNLIIDGTLGYGTTSSTQLLHIYGNFTINSGGYYNSWFSTTGKRTYIGGNIVNNGTMDFSIGAGNLVWVGGAPSNISGTGSINTFISNIWHINSAGVTYNAPVEVRNVCGLYEGAVNPNGNLTLGNIAVLTQTIERTSRGSFTALPTFTAGITRSVSYITANNHVPTKTTYSPGFEIPISAGIGILGGTLAMSTYDNIQLSTPVEVGTTTTGALTLTRGILITSDVNLLTLNSFIAGAAGTSPSILTPPTTHGSYVSGPMRINFPATGTTTRNFALGVGTGFNGVTPNSNVLKTLAIASTTTWTGSTVKASIVNAPSGSVNSPLTFLLGPRAYYLDLLGGADLPGTATVTIRGRNSTFGNSDNMFGDIGELRVAQSPSLTGPWTERSTTSGTGVIANNTDYARTTAVAAPGPIAPLATYGQYFAFATTATVINPSGVTATTIGTNQINIAFTPNIFNNNVVIVFNNTGTFTIPTGPPPTPGSAFAGGTLIYNGTSSPFNHSGLSSSTSYYYKLFSYDGIAYSTGVDAFATTPQIPTTIPFSEGFETWPNNWTVLNSAQVNQWYVGTATSHTGTQSAYVSYDGGTTNEYTITSTSVAHLYRDIIFPGGSNPFNLKFNWKGQGEGSTTFYDYMRVFLVPTSTVPVAGTLLTTGQVGGTYNLQADWQTVNIPLDNATYANQTWRLVVTWRNDGSLGTQPPAAIDDIEVTVLTYPAPSALTASSITTNSAILSWTQSGSPASWDIEYGPIPFTPTGTPTITGVTNPRTVTGLSAATSYAFYVRANFGSGNYSTWSGPGTFTTLCSVVASFTEGFDAVTPPAFPNCWAKVGTGGSASTQTTNNFSPPNCLYIYSSSTSSLAVVSMPPVSNAGSATHQLRLKARANFTVGGVIQVGYLTNPNDAATFVKVDSIVASSLTYQDYIVILGTAPGSNQVLAFRHSGSPANSILIDDVVWEVLPTCPAPTSLNATGITANSAILSWTQAGSPASWQIEYGPTPFTPTGTPTLTGVTNPYTLSGLSSATEYAYYVRAFCGGSDYSTWSGPFTFTTSCTVVSTFPWGPQNFDVAVPPPCWSKYVGLLAAPSTLTTTTSGWIQDDWRNVLSPTNKAAKINIWTTTVNYWLMTPQIDLGTGTPAYQLEFDLTLNAYATSNPPGLTGTDDKFAVVISTDGGTTWTSANTLRLWDNAGSSYVYNNINPAGEKVKISLSGYTGVVQIGFYGESTLSNADNDLMIDNVVIKVPLANDVGTLSIDVASNQIPGSVVPQATVKNYGTSTNSFNVTMTITGGYSSTKTVSALAPDATQQVTFDNWNATLGQKTVKVYTQLGTDGDASNDTLYKNVGVYAGSYSSGNVHPTNTYLGSGVAASGYLYSIGGNTTSLLGTECYKYNVATNTWTPIASLPAGRRVLTTANVGNFIYAIGGSDMSSVYQSTVYKYDIALDSWSTVAPLPIAIAWGKAVGYNNRIYFAGGVDAASTVLSSVYVYDVTANTWSAGTSMPGPKFGGAFSIVGNQLIYVAGADATVISSSVYVGTIDGGNPLTITWATASDYPGIKELTYSEYAGCLSELIRPDYEVIKKEQLSIEAVAYPPGTMYRFDGAPWGADGMIVANGSPTSAWVPADPNPTYVYKPSSDTWEKQADVPIPVLGASLGTVNTGSIWKLVIASGLGAVEQNATQIYTADLGSAPTTFQLTVSVNNGWNMVSIPGLHPVDQNVLTWWSGKDPAAGVFRFSGGYLPVTVATPGQGYWMKHSGVRVYNTGDEWPAGGINIVSHNSITGATGWNLIGGYEQTVLTSGITTTPGGLQTGQVFGYSGGYTPAVNLVPGYGYWIKLTGPGQINIPSLLFNGPAKIVEKNTDDWGKIIITDNSGKSYTLYTVKGEVNLSDFDLPPAPPEGMFDVRFGSGRYAELLSAANQTIELNSLEYPVKVKVENANIKLQDETGKIVNERVKPGEEIVIASSFINKLLVSSNVIPDKYALEQNYPNPFNPSTKIEFSLPEDVNNVTLTIYNALGQRVAELVNSKMEAGKYSYLWNAGNVATGMYIYELRTDKFVSVKKMMLLK